MNDKNVSLSNIVWFVKEVLLKTDNNGCKLNHSVRGGIKDRSVDVKLWISLKEINAFCFFVLRFIQE